MPLLTFFSGSFAVQNGDHLRSGIICGTIWGSFAVLVSFAVQSGDHLRFWDHLRSWDHLRTRTSVLEFQQNDPQNRQKIVTLMNNKVAAITKRWNYLVINILVLESKFLIFQKQWSTSESWAIVIFVLNSHISCQNL